MEVFILVFVSRETSESNPEIEVTPYTSREDAVKALNDAANREIAELESIGIDLADPKNDGTMYMDGDDHFAFYRWVGGDWYYTADIYKRTIC